VYTIFTAVDPSMAVNERNKNRIFTVFTS
jgi:hypothetical protein